MNPIALPLARLRSLGCRVGTTVSHNGHDWTPAKGALRGYFWEYVVTLPVEWEGASRIPVDKATIREASGRGAAVIVYSYDRDSVAEALTMVADLIEEWS